MIICSDCNKEIKDKGKSTCGHCLTKEKKPICYDCCGIRDKMELYSMKKGDKVILYFNGKYITNWPGTLIITPFRIKKSRHNFAGIRIDTWFTLNNKTYHGYTVGQNTEIHRIQITKH